VFPCSLFYSRRPNNSDRNTKGGRGDRGGRGERVAPRDGKRAYDRRSGTGRGKEIKKGGGGARNWGSDKAEAKKMEGTINEDEVKEEKPVEVSAEGEEAAEKEAPVEEKVEDKTMTFADYMAVKGKKEEIVVRDLEDEFKGLAASTKTEEDFLVMGGGKQKKPKKKQAEKKSVEVGFRVVSWVSTCICGAPPCLCVSHFSFYLYCIFMIVYFRQKPTTVMKEVIAMIVAIVVVMIVVVVIVVVEEEVAAEEEVVVDGTDAEEEVVVDGTDVDVVVLKERTLASTFKTRPPSHLCRRLMSVFWCFEEILSHCGCKRSTF
jgi:hypothetical protein